MPHSNAEEQVTALEIRAIAASIYEPQARVWVHGGWSCPQCRKVNEKTARQCVCGISRDGLPEFGSAERTCSFPTEICSGSFSTCYYMDSANPDIEPDRSNELSPPLKGVAIIFVPALLTWFGLIEVGIKIWARFHG
jgi:hypothetical protein